MGEVEEKSDVLDAGCHAQLAYTSWSKVQRLRSDGIVELDGSCLDIPSVVAIAR